MPEQAAAPHPIPLPTKEWGEGTRRRTFDNTQVWIFDLDNTLYPAECNLFAQVDRRMGAVSYTHLTLPTILRV